MPQILRKKRIRRGEAMLEEEGIEGIWVVRMCNTFEIRAVLSNREFKGKTRDD